MDYFQVFDLLIGGYGLYFLYQIVQSRLRRQPFPPQNILSRDMTLETCRDVEAYTAFIIPRVLCLALLLIAYAVIAISGILDAYSLYFYFVVFLILVPFYVVTVKQARQRFWTK